MSSHKIIVPKSQEELQERIVTQYDQMSKRLRLVGDFFVQNPNTVALENIVAIASEIQVSPSTLVRFANFFGFKGFTDLQQLYRGQLRGQVNGYRERVRTATKISNKGEAGHQLLERFANIQCNAIDSVSKSVSPEDFDKALDRMSKAKTIYITGVRRAFPVAFYLAYALIRAEFSIVLIDDTGSLQKNLLKRATADDLLIAVSFHPHANETTEAIQQANKRQCETLVISDHSIHPANRFIDQILEVREAEMMAMRSLSSSMHLAQCLVMGLLCRQEGPLIK